MVTETHDIPEPAGPPQPTGAYLLPIVFTGSGSEYFRIWSVNLMLTLATLGLYYPWAKVRRLRYFYGCTRIGGHALDFHGRPSTMFRGYMLVVVLAALYSVAGKVSAGAGLLAGAVVAAIAPALVRAGLRFRLANTSWRGLRFGFDGSLGGAYRALLPLAAPALAGGLVAFATRGERDPGAAAVAGLLPLALTVGLVPLCWWLLKRYQHGHYRYGAERSELRVGPGPFYRLLLKTLGGGLAALVVGVAVVGALGGATLLRLRHGGVRDPSEVGAAVAMVMVGIVIVYLGVLLAVQPYAVARAQNLVWNRTASANLRFVSTLRFRALAAVTLKNALLIPLTLGFYVPFARIAVARLRLDAVSVQSDVDPDSFEASPGGSMNDAAGEAAGDLFGFDVGL